MIDGPSPLAAHGLHANPSDLRPAQIPEYNTNRIDALERRYENGKLDTDKLQQRLEKHFGKAADGIIGEDGTVDFEKLRDLISSERTSIVEQRLVARFGEDAESVVGEDGSINTDELKTLVIDKRIDWLQEKVGAGELDTEKFQARLERRYGEEAHGVVGEDGAVDFDALRNLLEEQDLKDLVPRAFSRSLREQFADHSQYPPFVDFEA